MASFKKSDEASHFLKRLLDIRDLHLAPPCLTFRALPLASRIKIGSHLASEIGTWEVTPRYPGSFCEPLTCTFNGVSEGTRTPDTQDHNLVL